MTLGAVGSRVDVVSAGEDQSVDQFEDLVRVGLELGVGRDHHRQPTRGLDRSYVAVGE